MGIRTPQASWGNIVQYATNVTVFSDYPWVWVPPSLCIVATVFALQFVGDGLRDAMDPKYMPAAGLEEDRAVYRDTPEELRRLMEEEE